MIPQNVSIHLQEDDEKFVKSEILKQGLKFDPAN